MICDPSLTALFTPPHPQLGRYEVCTTAESIQDALAQGRPDGLRDGIPEPLRGEIEPLEALDAFGTAGPYNRAALARLYGGSRVRVARRWRQRGDEFVSETLLSPYPNATLTELIPGTMVIRFTVEHVQRSGPRQVSLRTLLALRSLVVIGLAFVPQIIIWASA